MQCNCAEGLHFSPFICYISYCFSTVLEVRSFCLVSLSFLPFSLSHSPFLSLSVPLSSLPPSLPPTEDNGFNPVWNEGCEFEVFNPELALIRFVAQDEDVFGDPNFIGQATFPVISLRPGFRSVPLKNQYNDDLELSTLLVHVEIRTAYEEDEELYTTVRWGGEGRGGGEGRRGCVCMHA